MKILVLYYSPWWNATAYYCVSLVQGLQRAGHDVWLGTDTTVPAGSMAAQRTIRVFDIKLQTLNPLKALFEIMRLKKFVKKENIQIVNTLSPQGHLFHFLGRMNVPLVRTCCDAREPKNHWLNRKLYTKWVNWLIFPCKANFDRYFDILKIPPTRTSVIYAGIDLETFDNKKPGDSQQDLLQYGKNQKIIGIVGRLSPEKGHRHFLHVAAKVSAKVKNVKFVIVGKECQVTVESLRQLSGNLGIDDKVHFTGFLNDPRMAMSEFTLGVITSKFSETIARVALEYMAARKPVIATNVNVLGEIIRNERTGKVFEIDDVNGMADVMIELLHDPRKCEEWGNNSRADVEANYTIEHCSDATVNVFVNVLKKRGTFDK